MVGYLNAPSPIDKDGWMTTGDLVEERGGLIRFLGRITEVINVGGQKVTPTDVETILMQAENVAEATVHAIPHPILGQAVAARISLLQPEDKDLLAQRLREYCRERLQKYKIPMRFEVAAEGTQMSSRAKKIRAVATKQTDEQR
jgi:acyl-CoA synthetase (AMP-forming)/AMP-acid ligase II